MKLALQPVPRSPGAKTAPPNLSTCAQCPSIDSAIALFPRTAGPYRDLRPASPALQNAMPVSSFRINTCESVSKQRTLTSFRINTYEKPGGGGYRSWPVAFALAKIRISAQQSGGTPWDVAGRPASPLCTRLEAETQLHRVRTLRDKTRSAERRQEIANVCLVGQVH